MIKRKRILKIKIQYHLLHVTNFTERKDTNLLNIFAIYMQVLYMDQLSSFSIEIFLLIVFTTLIIAIILFINNFNRDEIKKRL